MAVRFQTRCYLCNQRIFAITGRGTFYKDNPDGDYHKKTCPTRRFVDKDQSIWYNNLRTTKILNAKQYSAFPLNKIARICWNTNNWEYPSGLDGKSKYKSFERDEGFGTEEWMFNLDKRIEDYIYAHLQPIKTDSSEKLNLLLYTIDSNTTERYLVGEINNVEVIEENLSNDIFDLYEKLGWIDEMKAQVKEIDGNYKVIDKYIKGNQYFNVRYKPNDINYLGLIPIEERFNIGRYVLLNREDYKVDIKEILANSDISDHNDSIDLNMVTKHYSENEKEYPDTHSFIQDNFLIWLRKKFPDDDIIKEFPKGRNRIDIKRITGGKEILFYEVKSYTGILTSIRMAIGQLLEYNCFPESNLANKLIIVSHVSPSDYVKLYIKHLQKCYNLPIEYIYFDLNSKNVEEHITV